MGGWWDAFWQQWQGPRLDPGETYVPGISPVPRGAHDAPTNPLAVIASGGDMARALPVQGPIRMLSSLADARYLTPDFAGLALAWAGGSPPYEIVLETEDGATIAQFHCETTFLWQSDWRMPPATVRVRIYDANDRVVRAEVTPSPALPRVASTDDLASAIELFQTQRTWRYDALRRLARLAAQDPTAARAVLTIRLAK
jgi:hypothetical protein